MHICRNLLVLLTLFALVISFAWAFAPSPSIEQDGGIGHYLDPNTNPMTHIVHAFEEGGWPLEWAVFHAHGALNVEYPGDAPTVSVDESLHLLDPHTSPLAIMHHAFEEGGWDSETALELAAASLGLPAPAAATTSCDVYEIQYDYCGPCKSNPANDCMLWGTTYIDKTLLESIEGCLQVTCMQDERPWYGLTLAGGCGSYEQRRDCFSFKKNKYIGKLVCSSVPFQSGDCFEETDPLDCQSIEMDCCQNGRNTCIDCAKCVP